VAAAAAWVATSKTETPRITGKGDKMLQGKWQAYTLAVSDSDAARRFVKRHGYDPERVIRSATMVLCGPIQDSAPAIHVDSEPQTEPTEYQQTALFG